MSAKSFTLSLLLVIGALVAVNSVFIVTEIERAVLLRLGKMHNADVATGLAFKWPFADEIRKFDARVLTLDARPERFLTSEKKSLQVDSFAKWRIVDVGKYYTATSGDKVRAERLLAQRINQGLRDMFAIRTLQEVVSGERDELMAEIKTELNRFTDTALGVEVVDVRVKRIDLPDEVSEPVYSRMRAEREREAKEHRAMGREKAEVTRAEADRESIEIEARAYRESEQIRGKGDATAAAIYATAYNKDPEFYSFTRSLGAYQEAFRGKEDLMVIDPDSDFFSYLNKRGGK